MLDETKKNGFSKSAPSFRPPYTRLPMRVRETIFDCTSKADLFYALQSRFDSRSKADLFYGLQSRWCHRLRVCPALVLSKMIDVKQDKLSPKRRKMLKQSAVDLTFCDLHGRLLFSIDVDEIGGGFSHHAVYHEGRKPLVPAQKKEIEFKLKVANIANYPLIVVSDEELEPLTMDQHEPFTVVDGIVGRFVTIAETRKRLDGMGDTSETEIEEIEAEVATEINPIIKKQMSIVSFALEITTIIPAFSIYMTRHARFNPQITLAVIDVRLGQECRTGSFV